MLSIYCKEGRVGFQGFCMLFIYLHAAFSSDIEKSITTRSDVMSWNGSVKPVTSRVLAGRPIYSSRRRC